MERYLSWQVLAVAALFIGPAVWALLRAIKRRRDHQVLDESGMPATAQVAVVEPMQRSVNGAAGHPVTLALPDGRQVRDTTGLGGYIARVGSHLTVRYAPAKPDLVRVDAINGPHGPYPVTPDGRTAPPSLVAPLVGVSLAIAITVGTASFEESDDGGVPSWFGLLFLAIGLALLVISVAVAVRNRRQRRRLTGGATGTVTEVWSELVGSGQHRSTVYPFTVYFATGDGREVHARCPSATRGFHPRPPQPVRVRYDPAYPPRFDVWEVRHAGLLTVLIFGLVGSIFVLFGAIWTAFMM